MNEEEIMAIENAHLAGVYQKFPLSIVKGKGSVVYDANGKEYIDCMSGYGVSLVGHCHPKVASAIREQSEKLISCHGSHYNDKRAELLEKLVKISPKGLNKVFLSNSGAESVECALKVAVKHAGKTEIVGMLRGFHGKTLGALSATWNPKYRKAFQPLIGQNFKFVPFGKIEKVEKAVTDETAAVIVEPVQGEGGVHVAPDGYLQDLRDLCDKQDVVLIFDEVQTGFGRTGHMWASEHWGITPDVMCVAKAMGGGVPIGATIAKEEIMNSLKVGEHSSTFGGNPLACAAACATIDVILEERLVDRAQVLGEYFKNALQKMVDDFRVLREVRGLGLMIGLESRIFIYNVLMKALEKGLILLYAGKNVIRFLPPLVIENVQLEKAAAILTEVFSEEEKKALKRQ
ncbi:MAG: aspartate aminotransferase family protein [Candidatus Bathyarchaeota archaeon]|nr:aspartate aminotransferase family protein [Candidatus Bathyarchaeota archaeon]